MVGLTLWRTFSASARKAGPATMAAKASRRMFTRSCGTDTCTTSGFPISPAAESTRRILRSRSCASRSKALGTVAGRSGAVAEVMRIIGDRVHVHVKQPAQHALLRVGRCARIRAPHVDHRQAPHVLDGASPDSM